MRVCLISFLNVGYFHFIDFDKDLIEDFMTLYPSVKLAPFYSSDYTVILTFCYKPAIFHVQGWKYR